LCRSLPSVENEEAVTSKAESKAVIVLPFSALSKDAAWLVGGKGANLGELASAGFPVPSGFCITKYAFEAHMQQRLDSFGTSQASLWKLIEESSDRSPKEAQELLMKTPILSSLRAQIIDGYRKLCQELGQENAMVAVRSSATAEDSADASFAGQLDTFLGITGEEAVVDAVLECWASLYSERVDSYRKLAGRARGTKTSSISVCVVVQQMLDADCAGVMFTANPFTQSLHEFVITGNWGLGESVVADIATPDTWILRRNGSTFEVISEAIAVKKKKVVLSRQRSTQHGGCSEIVDIVDPVAQATPCATKEQLIALASLGLRIQDHYGGHPQDTEWGLKNGKVYLLQARPITTLSDEPPRAINEFDTPCRAEDWITTCNAAEMFPGPMTPLTMSTFGRMADEGVQRMQILFGCRRNVDKVNRVTANYYGHFFLNMTNTLAPMCAGMVGAKMAKDNGEMSILGSLNHGESLERLFQIGGGQRFFPIRLLNGARYAYTMITAPFRVPIMQSRIIACKREFERALASRPTAAQLWSEIDSMMDAYDDQWTDGIITSSTSAAAMLFAMKLLTEPGGDVWGSQPVAELAMLLGQESAHGSAESTGPVEAVDRLRDTIVLSHATSAASFAASSPEEALLWLRSKPNTALELADLLDRHGHRCVREAEMREKDWFEDSLPLVRMLQASVRAALAKKSDKIAPDAANESVNKTPVESLISAKAHLNAVTRSLLLHAVDITRRSVHLREYGKSLQVKLNALFKHAYRRLGNIMVDEGRLPDADLLYFLTHAEIGELACAPVKHLSVHRLKTRATQRRRLLPQQVQLRFPELSQGAPTPIKRTEGVAGVAGTIFQGTAVSAGMAKGPARVARTLEEADLLQEGEILITPQTDVGWTPYFSIAAGLVTEIGGMLSHGAVVAREYSLPCVVGVTNACETVKSGSIVQLDGDTGRLIVISEAKN